MRHLIVKIFVMCLASLSSTMIFAQEVLHVRKGRVIPIGYAVQVSIMMKNVKLSRFIYSFIKIFEEII